MLQFLSLDYFPGIIAGVALVALLLSVAACLRAKGERGFRWATIAAASSIVVWLSAVYASFSVESSQAAEFAQAHIVPSMKAAGVNSAKMTASHAALFGVFCATVPTLVSFAALWRAVRGAESQVRSAKIPRLMAIVTVTLLCAAGTVTRWLSGPPAVCGPTQLLACPPHDNATWGEVDLVYLLKRPQAFSRNERLHRCLDLIRLRSSCGSSASEQAPGAELPRLCSAEVLDYVETVGQPIGGEEPLSLAAMLALLEKSQCATEPSQRAKLEQLKKKHAQ